MNNKIFAYFLLSSSFLIAEPLTLSKAYEMALKNEPRIQSAFYQTEATSETVEQYKARLYPQLQGSASWGRYEYEAKYLNKPVKENYMDYSISATQAVFHPEYWRSIDQAKTKRTATTFDYQVKTQQLGLELTKAYFMVLREYKNVELALSQKEYYGQKYKQLEEMLKFGLTNRIDLLETKIQLDKATSQWLTEQKRTHVAKLRLEHMVGSPIDQLQPFDIEKINTVKLAMERIEWEKKILQNPSMKASQLRVQAAQDEIAIRNYDHYPKVDLSLNRKETDSSDPYTHLYDNQAIIKMSIPLYQGGYTQSRVKEALLLLNAAQKEQEYYQQETKAKFEEAWEEQQFSIENFNNLKASQKSAELYLESIEKAHASGLKSVVDLLEAKAKVYEIKRDLIDAGYEMINNHLSLLDAVGELNVENISEYEKLFL